MPKATTSAVVVTYNGARWIDEQLRSILGQTRAVDEIVIADDASTDTTAATVSAVLESWPGRVVRIQHPTTVGVRANLTAALTAATGDIVFLSDQDDRWHPTKVARLLGVLRSPNVGMAFTDAATIGPTGNRLVKPSTLWRGAGFDRHLQRRWELDPIAVLVAKEVVTGATVAIRRDIALRSLPFPSVRWHDSWLAFATLLTGHDVIAVPQPLIDYRLHSTNAAGLPSRAWATRLARTRPNVMARVDCVLQWREAVARFEAIPAGEAARAYLADAGGFASERMLLPAARWRRLGRIATDVRHGKYRTFAHGIRSILFDALAPAPDPQLQAEVAAALHRPTEIRR